MRTLLLMTTLGCHLCDKAEAVLLEYKGSPVQIDLVDIATEPDLLDKYGARIPVLVDSLSNKTLAWPFDQAQLVTFLHELPN